MIEKTKQLVESKYTLENGYDANAKVRAWSRLPALQGPRASYHSSSWVERDVPPAYTLAGGLR